MARVARFTRLDRGPLWFIAVCEACRWMGLSWKHFEWATDERDRHNGQHHVAPPVEGGATGA